MADLNISPATIIIALAVIALVVVAVRRMLKRGTCDCGGSCDRKASKSARGGCPSCSGADAMVADMDRAAKQSHLK